MVLKKMLCRGIRGDSIWNPLLLILISFSLLTFSKRIAAQEWHPVFVSEETIGRLSFTQPISLSKSPWSEVSSDYFPWHPRQYIKGWQKTLPRGLKAGIFVAVQAPDHKLAPNEYARNLSASLSESPYSASLIEDSYIEVSGYSGESIKFGAPHGNGLFFTEGNIPTIATFVAVYLEKEPKSDVWPVVLVFCAAPRDFYNQIEPELQSFLDSIRIQPLPVAVAPPPAPKPETTVVAVPPKPPVPISGAFPLFGLGFSRTLTGYHGLNASMDLRDNWTHFLVVGFDYHSKGDSLNSFLGVGVFRSLFSTNVDSSQWKIQTGLMFGVNLSKESHPLWILEIPMRFNWEIIPNRAIIWVSAGLAVTAQSDVSKSSKNSIDWEIMAPFKKGLPSFGFTIKL